MACIISNLLFWISPGSLGKSSAASILKAGIGRPFSFIYFSSFSVSSEIFFERATMPEVPEAGAVPVSFATSETDLMVLIEPRSTLHLMPPSFSLLIVLQMDWSLLLLDSRGKAEEKQEKLRRFFFLRSTSLATSPLLLVPNNELTLNLPIVAALLVSKELSAREPPGRATGILENAC